MPLTWDSTAVEGDLTAEERTTRECLIFATMAVGINHITVDNAREFFARVSFWEKINGAYRQGSEGENVVPVYFTPEDILRFIGLRTNASTLTKSQFYRNVWDSHDRWNVPSNKGL